MEIDARVKGRRAHDLMSRRRNTVSPNQVHYPNLEQASWLASAFTGAWNYRCDLEFCIPLRT